MSGLWRVRGIPLATTQSLREIRSAVDDAAASAVHELLPANPRFRIYAFAGAGKQAFNKGPSRGLIVCELVPAKLRELRVSEVLAILGSIRPAGA